MNKEVCVNCVVVTYNRLGLLKENVAALLAQTYPIRKIIVIDNCSTDGTREWLEGFSGDGRFKVVRPERNLGGAGGFSLGLRVSVEDGCDYTWLMDDDTIPYPDSLELLVKPMKLGEEVGFSCSKVNWTDGKPHVMNHCAVKVGTSADPLPRLVEGVPVYPCTFCTFVSVLVGTEAVYRVGLPIKEFFIWCDDIEYTSRIYVAGFPCYHVPRSVVLHKSVDNYFPTADEAPAGMAWRFYYQARNTSYLKRRNAKSRLHLYLSILNKYRLYWHKTHRRKDGKGKEFRRAAWKGCRDGFTFNPPVEYVERKRPAGGGATDGGKAARG